MTSIRIVNAPGDAALAARLRDDLGGAGYTLAEMPAPGAEYLLAAVLSPEANANADVQAAITAALDAGQHIIPVLAKAAPLPELIDHLAALDFSENYDAAALLAYAAALTAPGAGRPLKVITPRVRQANRRIGAWLGGLALLWFIIGLILVGVYGLQAPREEFNMVDTLEAATVQSAISRNLPRTTEDAANFPMTVQAAPTAQRPLLEATATALVATPGR